MMLRTQELHTEDERFYVATKMWVLYFMMVAAGFVLGGLGIFFALDGHAPLIFCALFVGAGFLAFSGLFYNQNGKGGKKYGFKGQLCWGADKAGIFAFSQEARVTHYEWSRIEKIILAEKVIRRDEAVIEGVYFGVSDEPVKKIVEKKKVIVYVDQFNPPETKSGKFFDKHSSRLKARAFVESYAPAKVRDIEYQLKKYAPREVNIHYKEEWNLLNGD